jgi:ribosome-associated protein
MTASEATEVSIRGPMIRLGQLLKLAGIVDSGAAAKELLAAEAVAVNGAPERRRGRQLRDGDRIEVRGEALCVRGGAG